MNPKVTPETFYSPAKKTLKLKLKSDTKHTGFTSDKKASEYKEMPRVHKPRIKFKGSALRNKEANRTIAPLEDKKGYRSSSSDRSFRMKERQ